MIMIRVFDNFLIKYQISSCKPIGGQRQFPAEREAGCVRQRRLLVELESGVSSPKLFGKEKDMAIKS